jgi:hypothetical protein
MPLKSARGKWDAEMQAILEESIARRPKEPSVSKPPSMFKKLFFWFLVQKVSPVEVGAIGPNLAPRNGQFWRKQPEGTGSKYLNEFR